MKNTLEVRITSFNNPFSFFCVINESTREFPTLDTNSGGGHISSKKEISDVNHGQYVAVMWKQKWTRGVITMESQFLIWLVDYGIFIHPDEKTLYIDLPVEYKKHPTKVFEAAIHGVVPLDKYISDECCIENKMSFTWNKGAIEKCEELIRESKNAYFVPLALMSTKYNDVVLGDLYLEIPGKNIINLIDELELWPVFLEKNKQAYIENLAKFFTTRRKHHACSLKPTFLDINLKITNLNLNFKDYDALIRNIPNLTELARCASDSTDCETTVETEVQDQKYKNAYTLTPAEIERYSNVFITVHGVKYNVLNVLVKKAEDLRICERYKDLKSVGRGYSFRQAQRDQH